MVKDFVRPDMRWLGEGAFVEGDMILGVVGRWLLCLVSDGTKEGELIERCVLRGLRKMMTRTALSTCRPGGDEGISRDISKLLILISS